MQRFADMMEEMCYIVATKNSGSLKGEHGTGAWRVGQLIAVCLEAGWGGARWGCWAKALGGPVGTSGGFAMAGRGNASLHANAESMSDKPASRLSVCGPHRTGRNAPFASFLCLPMLLSPSIQHHTRHPHAGRNVAPYVEMEWGNKAYEMMWELKSLFDPSHTLNPGVILNRDPDAHLRFLKPSPAASPIINRCIECGFCESNCPSRDVTITPRQRITVFREMYRLRQLGDAASPEEKKQLAVGVAITKVCQRASKCTEPWQLGDATSTKEVKQLAPCATEILWNKQSTLLIEPC